MQVSQSVWGDVLSHVRELAIAYALAMPVGWERERAVRSAGLRTFPLVAIATCGLVLVAERVAGGSPEARARVLQGLITGTGFLAAGVVIKEPHEDAHGTGYIRGMTTAVSIWTIGVVGAAVGFGLYDVATVLSVAAFLTLRALAPLKRAIDARADASPTDNEESRP